VENSANLIGKCLLFFFFLLAYNTTKNDDFLMQQKIVNTSKLAFYWLWFGKQANEKVFSLSCRQVDFPLTPGLNLNVALSGSFSPHPLSSSACGCWTLLFTAAKWSLT